MHHGPNSDGHRGDMPVLRANATGQVDGAILVPQLKLEDIKGRAFVIHAGGDNYSDTPLALGGGGARIACGVVN
jgi:Cu-Zn family superoxide dismutase